MQSSKRVLVLLGALLLGTPLLKAQTATGSISGAVQDESRAVVPNANVVITNVDTGVPRSLTTDGAGRYHAPGLLPGHYEVQAQAEGFQTAVRKGIQLTVGSELAINLSLQVGQVAQTTIVTAEAPLVETVTNTLSGLVDDRAIRDLPLNGRSFDQLISLQSAAPTIQARVRTSLTGSANVFSVSGARTQSNQYLMDGTEVVGAGSVTTQPGGVLGTNMGVEAIREFQVLTSNYSAAYGKRSGGVINIATRSGTNQIHGSAFEFHRNDNLDARNFFDVDPANPLQRSDPPEFKRNQFGGALGGPLLRDMSFFFGTYEGLREALGMADRRARENGVGIHAPCRGEQHRQVHIGRRRTVLTPPRPSRTGCSRNRREERRGRPRRGRAADRLLRRPGDRRVLRRRRLLARPRARGPRARAGVGHGRDRALAELSEGGARARALRCRGPRRGAPRGPDTRGRA